MDIFKKHESTGVKKAETENAERAEKNKKHLEKIEKKRKEEEEDIAQKMETDQRIVELSEEEAEKLQEEIDNKVNSFFYLFFFISLCFVFIPFFKNLFFIF